VIAAAVARAGVDPVEIDDVVLGAAHQYGATGSNVARQSALRAGLPTSVPGMSVDRKCSSGLMAIAIAAKQIITDGMTVTVGGGAEAISLTQNRHAIKYRAQDPELLARVPAAYMSMIETAELLRIVTAYRARRRMPSRCNHSSARRRPRRQGGSTQNRADDHLDDRHPQGYRRKLCMRSDLAQGRMQPTRYHGGRAGRAEPGLFGWAAGAAGRFITAGNSSQLSDGASACVPMEAREAERRSLEPLGIYHGIAVAGCDPDEMGIGPIFAVPKLLRAHGLKVDDIGLWEMNEAFASQAIYCRDRLGLPNERLNVSGGAI